MHHKENSRVKANDIRRMLVLSLGTGFAKHEEKYDATKASKWGVLSWIYNSGSTPIIDFFSDASSDMVDYHVSTLFQSSNVQQNYLRIQVNSNSMPSLYMLLTHLYATYFMVINTLV